MNIPYLSFFQKPCPGIPSASKKRSWKALTLGTILLGTYPAGADVITAGNLIANLQNVDLNASSTLWVNQTSGAFSAGNFSTIGGGNANVQSVAGFNGLYINTSSANAMTSALSVPATITGNNSVSVEMWVYTDNLYSVFSANNVVGSYGGNSGGTFRQLGYGPNESGSNAFATGNFNDLGWNNGANPPTGAWTLVDYVYDGTSGLTNIYVNGTLARSATLNTLNTSASSFFLGTQTNQDNPFAGYIGAVRIQDGVLSQSDIANNYGAGVNGIVAVPEPSVYGLIFSGFLVIFAVLRRRGQAVC